MLIVAFIAVMIGGYAVNPQGQSASTKDCMLIALFPVGPCVGHLIAWRWPLLGGIVSLVCAAIFLVIMGESDLVGPVGIVAAPAVLFVFFAFRCHKE
ncbi:hypothetical protein ACFL6M_00555 [Candidatus Eisenbacteria bacterium]|uniref:DUF7670 domain-containing protein n=1 Tax=Eiseniibacteriota bacterium TaxID=2212470 RepID=A0ABV6YIB0_UNCEI